MDAATQSYYIVLAGLGLIILEVIIGAATGFELFVVGVILMISGGIGMLLKSFTVALASAAILLFAYVFIGRKYIKSRVGISTTATNIDLILGQEAEVVKTVTKRSAGQVRINGEVWRAISEKTHKEGDDVIIASISGVTLHVVGKNDIK